MTFTLKVHNNARKHQESRTQFNDHTKMSKNRNKFSLTTYIKQKSRKERMTSIDHKKQGKPTKIYNETNIKEEN